MARNDIRTGGILISGRSGGNIANQRVPQSTVNTRPQRTTRQSLRDRERGIIAPTTGGSITGVNQ